MKRNPQAEQSKRVKSQLTMAHYRRLFLWRGKPWLWAHPILPPKPRPGEFRPAPRFVHPYHTRRERDGISLRMVL